MLRNIASGLRTSLLNRKGRCTKKQHFRFENLNFKTEVKLWGKTRDRFENLSILRSGVIPKMRRSWSDPEIFIPGVMGLKDRMQAVEVPCICPKKIFVYYESRKHSKSSNTMLGTGAAIVFFLVLV